MDLYEDEDVGLDLFLQGVSWANASQYRVDTSFASMAKFDECVHLLNKMLITLDIPHINGIPKDEASIPALNSIHALLQIRYRDARIREELADRSRKLELERESAIFTQDKLEQKISQMERQISDLIMKVKIVEDSKKTEVDKLLAEKENVQRENIALVSRDAHYQHEIRRKDNEIEKIKDRLESSIRGRNPDSRTSINIIHAAEREGRKLVWSKDVKRSDDIVQMVRNSYEEKMKEAMGENASLRKLIFDLQRELRFVLSYGADEEGTNSIQEEQGLNAWKLDMPFQLLHQVIEEELQGTLNLLRVKTGHEGGLATVPGIKSSAQNTELQSLLSELESCRKKIVDQEQIIFMFMNAQDDVYQRDSSLDESFSESDVLRKEKIALQQEREQIQNLLLAIENKLLQSPAPKAAEIRSIIHDSPLSIRSRLDYGQFGTPTRPHHSSVPLPQESPIQNYGRATNVVASPSTDRFRSLPRRLGPDASLPGMHRRPSPTTSPNGS